MSIKKEKIESRSKLKYKFTCGARTLGSSQVGRYWDSSGGTAMYWTMKQSKLTDGSFYGIMLGSLISPFL